MAEVRQECELGAGVDEVWKVVGSFSGFIEAMGLPVEIDGEGVGQTRTINMGATPMVERLEELDDSERRIVYSIVSSPLPVSNYRSVMQLSQVEEGRTRLEWTGTFDPAGGDEAAAISTVTMVYQGGIKTLQDRFGA